VSYALYTIWLLDELLADRLPPPIGSHKRTLAGGGIPLSKPSTAAAPATAPAVGKVSVPANSSSINGGTRNNRVLPRESGEIGEGAGARPERDSFAVKAATGMNDDENVNWPTWGPGSDWVLQEEESLTNLSSDDSFAAVAYCAAALAVSWKMGSSRRSRQIESSSISTAFLFSVLNNDFVALIWQTP